MADQDRFRFRIDEEEPEVPFAAEDLNRRVSRLSQRISFLTLLLPCLLGVALYVAYRDISQRLNRTQTSETQSFDRIAAETEQKTAAFAGRLADLETGLTVKMDAMQKSLQALQEEFRKGDTAADKSLSAKADRKEVSDALARMEASLAALGKEVQSLAPLREEFGSVAGLKNDLGGVSSRLQKLESGLGKDLTGLAGYMERTKADLDRIKNDLSGLQARKLDRESLELEMLKTKRLYQMALDEEIARMDKALNTLQRRLEQVEKAFGARSSPSLPPLTGGIKEQAVE